MFHVKSSRPFARQHKGQALVEFSLTLMVFLLLLFLIIEVARILQAYVTVQHAARLAARYATTGHWESEYNIDPLAGWSYPTDDPMEAIRPCWPAFPDDPILAGTPQQIPAGKDFYQPFRNARTCSIEATAIKGMTGLALDPAASPNSPNYYQIVVWGAGNGVDFTDTFTRNGVSGIPYSNYGYGPDEPEFWAYRGFGGDPQQKVIVKIEYWVRINTPILNDIAPAVRVEGTAIMTNEAFGSTGLQREAIVAPELPPVDTSLTQPSPPDMIVDSITYLGPVSTLDDTDLNLDAEEPARFEFVVKNKGTTDVTSFIPPATDYRVSVYAYPASPAPSVTTPLSGGILIGQTTLSQMLIAGASSAPFQIDVTFPLGTSPGDYTVVAWVDSNYTAGTHENGDILENDILFTNQEANNAKAWTGGPIDLNYTSGLDLVVSFWDAGLTGTIVEADQGDHVVYRVQVTNNGSLTENNVVVNLDAATPSGLINETAESVGGNGYAADVWDVGTVNPSQTVTLDLGYDVDLGVVSGTSIFKTSHLFDGTGFEVETDQASILIGAVDVSISKTVSDSTPEVGDSITYTLTVNNLGTNQADGVTFIDSTPSEALSFVSVSNAGCSELDDGTVSNVTCNLGSMTGSSSVVVDIVYQVVGDNNGATIVNTANVTTTSAEAVTSNNTATANVDVQTPDIEVTVESQATGGVNTDEEVEFLITVENIGAVDALNVEVDLNPDSGLLEGDDSGHEPDPSSGTSYSSLVWTIGTLGPSSTRTLSIWFYADPATVDQGDLLELVATGTTTSYESLIDQGNNEDSDYLLVETTADLYVQEEIDGSPTDSFTMLDPGQIFEYTVIVGNIGPDDTNDVVVTDLGTLTSFAPLAFSAPTVTVTGGSSTPTVTINSGTGDLEIEFLEVGQEVQVSYDVLVSTDPTDQGEQVDYELEVSGEARNDPDISNNTESHTMMITPGSLYVNAGDENSGSCDSDLTWGADDPILGENVSWLVNQPYGSGNTWGYWGSPWRRYDDQPPIWQDPAHSAYLTADGSTLFGCRVETRWYYGHEFGYTFDDLLPGNYEVFTIFQDTDTTRRFTIEASGDGGTVWGFILGSASEGFNIIESLVNKWSLADPTDAYNVYDLERTVIPVIDNDPIDNLGQIQLRVRAGTYYNNSGNGRLMGLGYRFYGPLSTDPLPEGFHQDDDYRINYVGTWSEVPDSNASAGSYHGSTDNSAQIAFQIDGDGLVLYRTLHVSNPGDMEVCIDGEASPCGITIDNSSTTTEWTRPYFITGLGAGTHLIVINNLSPVGGLFELDAIQVLPALTPLTSGLHEETELYDIYNWTTVNTGNASGGSYYKTTDPVSSVIFQIDGDGVTITSRTDDTGVGYGMMEVCVDGEESPCARTIDLNVPAAWQVPFPFTGLGAGTHTIVINNISASSSQEINIDAVTVTP